MQIQKTNLSQSAAGSLLAALAKSGSSDTVSFQRHFAETIDAITPRRQSSGRQQQSVESDARDAKPKVERRKTERVAQEDRVDPRPQAADTQAAAPVETRSSAEASESPEPTTDTSASDVSTEAAASAEEPQPKPARPQAARQTSADGQPVEQAEGPSMSEAARALLVALGEVARAVIADSAAADQAAAVDPAALAAPAAKLQTIAPAASTDDGQAADKTTPEFAVKDALDNLAAKNQPDESTALAARRATVRLESQSAQTGQDKGPNSGSSTAEQSKTAQTPQPLLQNAAARAAVQAAQAVPQVQAEVVVMNVAAPTPVSADGAEDATLGRIAAPSTAAKSVAATANTPSTDRPSANQTEQIDRIARVMRASIGRGGSRVNLSLEPRDLGPLRIQMNLRGSELTARFETQTETARQYLEQSMSQLREGLAQGGIRLVEATVENHGPQGETLDGQGDGQQQASQGQEQGGRQPGQQEQGQAEAGVPRWVESPAGRDTVDITV